MDYVYVAKDGALQYENLIEEINDKINKNNKEKALAMADAPGDGWHDNFAAEDAARVEKMLIEEKNNLLKMKMYLKLVDNDIVLDAVNINSKVVVEFDDGLEEIILTGKFRPICDNEVTLNSEVGKAIYHKKKGDKVSYFVGEKEINVCIKEISS